MTIPQTRSLLKHRRFPGPIPETDWFTGDQSKEVKTRRKEVKMQGKEIKAIANNFGSGARNSRDLVPRVGSSSSSSSSTGSPGLPPARKYPVGISSGGKSLASKEKMEKDPAFEDSPEKCKYTFPSDVENATDYTQRDVIHIPPGGKVKRCPSIIDVVSFTDDRNLSDKGDGGINPKSVRKCDRSDVRKTKKEGEEEEEHVSGVMECGKTLGDLFPASPLLPGYNSTPPSHCGGLFVLVEKAVVLAVVLTVFSVITNVPVICAENTPFDKEIDPVFLEPVPNVTVAVGRDASLTCAVDHLGLHKVAWIHLDRQMIVSIHNHVITRQPRFTVTHDSHKTWTLQVTGVTEEDRGQYMCQVNTKPMISQTGYLQVVVPPNIVDKASSKSNIVVREKDNVTLVCRGEGFPLPQIKWRREDGQPIETSDGRKAHQMDGPKLVLRQVSRTHMGAYLCIATNGVPPSVSKRITLDVEFSPQMHVPNQLVGSALGTDVHLECFVEAHPRAITYWEFLDSMVMNSSRVTTHTIEDRYKIHMILSIKDLKDSDFGMYKCISKNSISETDGSITLNKTPKPTSPPQIMLHGYEDEDNPYRNRGRPGRKELHRKQQEESRRRRLQLEEEEKKQREREEARIRKEMERQRLEMDYTRGQRNQQATRVTHTQNGSASPVAIDVFLVSSSLLALCLHRLRHI